MTPENEHHFVFLIVLPLYWKLVPFVEKDMLDSSCYTHFVFQVDLVLFGHVHNYERTCAVYQSDCKAMPTKDKDGFDTYDNSNYSAPIHAVIGMAGFTLDEFSDNVSELEIFFFSVLT